MPGRELMKGRSALAKFSPSPCCQNLARLGPTTLSTTPHFSANHPREMRFVMTAFATRRHAVAAGFEPVELVELVELVESWVSAKAW